MAQPDIAIQTPVRETMPGWVRLAMGGALCVVIAVAAEAADAAAPLVGAPIFAIAFGVILTNGLRGFLNLGALRIGEVSKLCLKGGIILLGASLDLGDIVRTGADSLPLLVVTIAAATICSLLPLKDARLPWNLWSVLRVEF